MKQTLAILVFTLIVFTGNTLIAQNANLDSETNSIHNDKLTEHTTDNWTFYADEDNKVYYIDFENINFNLSDVVVKNRDGEVVMRDDVLDLPVDTIYEIDLNQYSTGKYLIELRSFTSIIKKEVDLK